MHAHTRIARLAEEGRRRETRLKEGTVAIRDSLTKGRAERRSVRARLSINIHDVNLKVETFQGVVEKLEREQKEKERRRKGKKKEKCRCLWKFFILLREFHDDVLVIVVAGTCPLRVQGIFRDDLTTKR